MSTAQSKARGNKPLAVSNPNLPNLILRLLGLAFIDAFAFWLLYRLISDRFWPLVIALGVVTLGINLVFLREDLYPLRWISPGLALLILMALYPIFFTVYTAFTNYSDGHLLTKEQLINLLGREQYLAEGAPTYRWVAFRSDAGEFVLWLTPEVGPPRLAYPDEIQNIESMEEFEGQLGEDGIPESIDGYRRLSRAETFRYLSELSRMEFGEAPDTVRIRDLNVAAQLQQRYVYDNRQDAIIDQSTNTTYYADGRQGLFVSEEGQALSPGYYVITGFGNFTRLLSSPALRGPFVRVFLWTFAFAILSVLTTFALGLFLAIVFEDINPLTKKLVRSFLIIPYTIPGVIGILIWRGMLNPNVGVISNTMREFIGWAPPWLSDQWWTKIGILLVNLWLGYPYMMLIASGALQSIPGDLYEAAKVDGASGWQRFWSITLPLLLVTVGPLLLASFSFNFNNFNVIYLFNEGGPPIPNTPTPAGHTDILISYTYRLAFGSGRGADYGYAAAIAFVIFLLVSVITIFNFRFTRIWEEVSESV